MMEGLYMEYKIDTYDFDKNLKNEIENNHISLYSVLSQLPIASN